jgi:O-acetylserine/cysteine efflux transporter
MRPRDLFLTLAVVLVWGLNYVFIKQVLVALPPLLVVALRYALIALPLLPFVKRPPIPLRWLAAYGIILGTLHHGGLFVGMYAGLSAGLASLVIQTNVFFTAIFAWALFKERIGLWPTVGMGLAASGLALIAFNTGQTGTFLGFTLVLASVMFWSVATMITRHASRSATGPVDPLSFMVWASVFPLLPTFALSLLMEGPSRIVAGFAGLSISVLTGLAFITYGSTLFGFVVWNRLIATYGATRTSQFSLLVPIVGMVSAAVFAGETLTPLKEIAAGLVIAGLAVSVFGARLADRVQHAKVAQVNS